MTLLSALLAAQLAWPLPVGAVAEEPGTLPAFGRPVYVNATASAGLEGFRHAGYLGPGNPIDTPALFYEFTGPGACWLDADGDGWLDLYLVNGQYATDPDQNAELDPHSQLYRNNADGTFTNVAASSGTDLRGQYQGCAAADYDNDGDTDLLVLGWGGNVLFRNDGGAFANVTAGSGLRDEDCPDGFRCWASSASWFDYDLDGCLDVYVNHFEPFDPADPPMGNGPTVGQQSRLFRNACDGTFADVTSAAGMTTVRNHWASVAGDYDNDGLPDLFVATDGDPDELWFNNGDGTFTLDEDTVAADPGSGMGAATGDWNKDGRLDLVVTNFVSDFNGIFQSDGDDYVDIGETAPFTDADPWSGWGVHVLDLNNDGWQDLMVMNGLTEAFGAEPREPMLAYEQVEGAWRSVHDHLGPDFQERWVLRGGAWGDYDNDGDVDLLAAEAGDAPTHLLRADLVGGNFLNVDLRATAAGVNRGAIGARATVSYAGVPAQMQEKAAGSSFMSTNDPRLHFGLGGATGADLEVRWPDGSVESFGGVRANAFVRVTQGQPLEVLRELPLVGVAGPSAAAYGAPTAYEATVQAGAGAGLAGVAWDFGEGGTAQGLQATHGFADVGELLVRATATDTLGRAKTQAMRVLVTDDLQAAVLMDQDTFTPVEQAAGRVRVAFSDGAPVRGADVHLRITYSSGSPEVDAAAALLPRFVRDALGYIEVAIDATTDASGEAAFTVPWTIPSPTDVVVVNANHPGVYSVEARGGARGSVFDEVQHSYRVGV